MSGGVKQLKDEGSQIQSVMAGGIAGMVSRFAIAPLDVIKIRLQLQTHSRFNPHGQATSGPVYDGALGTLKHILRHEGITGLWKGNIPAELMYICYGAIQFSAYRYSSHFLSSLPPPYRPSDTSTSFLSGAVAGTLATTTTYPLDLLRTRFAAQGTDRVYASIWSSIREIMSSEGYQGFFRGLTAGVGQIIPYMGLFFASYEAMKLPMANLDLPWGSGDAAAGLTASVLSKTAVYPLDTVRKRLQVQGPTRERYVNRNIPVYQGIGRSIRDIVKNEGPRGMYRGLTVSLLKAAPASAVTVWTYERAIHVLQKMGEALADDD